MSLKERVLNHLKTKGVITSYEAWSAYGVTRLADIVFQLRKDGMNIVTEKTQGRNRYGEKVTYGKYRLIDTEKPPEQRM